MGRLCDNESVVKSAASKLFSSNTIKLTARVINLGVEFYVERVGDLDRVKVTVRAYGNESGVTEEFVENLSFKDGRTEEVYVPVLEEADDQLEGDDIEEIYPTFFHIQAEPVIERSLASPFDEAILKR